MSLIGPLCKNTLWLGEKASVWAGEADCTLESLISIAFSEIRFLRSDSKLRGSEGGPGIKEAEGAAVDEYGVSGLLFKDRLLPEVEFEEPEALVLSFFLVLGLEVRLDFFGFLAGAGGAAEGGAP